ncbi:MAG: beta family protein [Phycisphaerae bacterium]|nr:beta family protein [Phycisphaerae bacterium]
MQFTHIHYVPCLRWKLGEYQGLLRLSPRTRCFLTPLIEVPRIGYDFENATATKTIDQHLAPFAKRVHEKWGRSACFVDLNLIEPDARMDTGIHPVRFISDCLRAKMCSFIMVTGLDRDAAYQREIRAAAIQSQSGVCLRLSIERAARGSVRQDLNSLLSELKVDVHLCDVIVDLQAPNFLPLEGFAQAIQAILSPFPHLKDWRSLTLLGTSFPKTMQGIRKRGEVVPRHEWQLYRTVIADFKKAGLRLPTFGDYAISHPDGSELDWRVVKPPATIRYTIDDGWYIVKGDNVRDYGFEQYHELSRLLTSSRYYQGPSMSWGDDYIERCANGDVRTGNLSTWRQVGTNHHIEKVTRDIASFYGSSSTS